MQKNRFILAGTLTLTMTSAMAQTVPQSGDLMRQVPQPAPATSEPSFPPVGSVPIEPPMQTLPNGGPNVNVAAFHVVGNRVINSDELMSQLRGEGNKAYSLPELETLALRLTRYYRTKGYFVARVYVPAQELEGANVVLRVVEGNYGRFVLENHSRVRNEVVQGLLDDVKKYDIVSLDTLERAMLIINDTPGVRVVRADVMPGERVGTSDFAIGAEGTPVTSGYVMLDNYGSRYTGRNRLAGNVDWNSPSGNGDRLSASGLLTNGTGLYNGRLGYSTLVASNGTRASAALARTRYDLGDRYEALGATGTADTIEVGLTTPFKRTRAASIEGGVTFAMRNLDDEISSTATVSGKRSYSATASVTVRREENLFGYSGVSFASVSLTGGYLEFRDATAEALDAAGSRTRGRFVHTNLSASHAALLAHDITVAASLHAQAALTNRNLDGSERLSVAGVSAVMGFPIGELSGDHAAILRLELSRTLALTGPVQWTASTFIDYGWARAVHPQSSFGESRTLGDIGLGLNMNMTRGGLAKIQLIHRTVGGIPISESMDRTALRFQAGWVF